MVVNSSSAPAAAHGTAVRDDVGEQRPGWSYTRSRDGTAVAWAQVSPRAASEGDATPVVLCNGIACSIDYWTEIARQLGTERRVVLWDYRGHGVSGPPTGDAVTIDAVIADLDAVLRASGTRRAVFVGHSFGVQVALEAARRRPEQIAGVVAIAGSAGAPLPPTATRWLQAAERAYQGLPRGVDDVWRAWWRSPLTHLAARAIGGTSMAVPREVMESYYEHVSTRDMRLLIAMMLAMQEHDASDVPATLDAPVLALAGDADRLTPLPVMARIALDAPHGELVVCHGGTHTLPAEHPDWVLRHMHAMLHRCDSAVRHIDLAAGA